MNGLNPPISKLTPLAGPIMVVNTEGVPAVKPKSASPAMADGIRAASAQMTKRAADLLRSLNKKAGNVALIAKPPLS